LSFWGYLFGLCFCILVDESSYVHPNLSDYYRFRSNVLVDPTAASGHCTIPTSGKQYHWPSKSPYKACSATEFSPTTSS
jgi:hypothetical protein